MDEMTSQVARDPVAKGCTRPAMQFGVPIGPLVAVVGLIVWISTTFNILLIFALLPIVFVMSQVTRTDDQAFRLLALRWRFRLHDRNRRFWQSTTYSPLTFKRRR